MHNTLIQIHYLHVLGILQIPFFDDVGAMTLQYFDSLFQRDNLQKSQFYKGLPKVLPKLPKVCLLPLPTTFWSLSSMNLAQSKQCSFTLTCDLIWLPYWCHVIPLFPDNMTKFFEILASYLVHIFIPSSIVGVTL